MNTPIIDFARNYAQSKSVRLHMPGHKGVSFLGGEIYDVTEIDGADVLYSAKGVILESEMNATSLYGSAKTLYSTEGSSLSIRAILHLVKTYALSQNRNAKILAYRNAHKTFVSASALLDVDVKWLYSTGNNILSCKIDTLTLESAIVKENPVAVYVTSPDYLGNVVDVKTVAEICHRNGVLLIVDNAHGAYLKFAKGCSHPVDLGADLVCDSAHKTLPCLTGSAYLHVGKSAPKFFVESAENALSLYASTSPSYLILQSLDGFNKVIADNPDFFDEAVSAVQLLKSKLTSHGYTLIGDESLKITIATKGFGYLGREVASILKASDIVVEFYDNDFVTMMFSPCNTSLDLERTADALLSIKAKSPIDVIPPCAPVLKQRLTPSKAIFAPAEVVAVDVAVGRILSSPTVSCPPAIPVAVCGEIIDESAVKCFKYYGVNTVLVVKE